MQEGQSLQFGDNVTVTCKKQEPFSFPFETKVKVRVTSLEVNVSGQPTHMCNHYQWIDWPDRGVPEADLAPIAILAKLKESTEPIIVHCSAGIGRTGCMVLIQHAMELLHKNEPLLEINGYLLELRKQRNNSIQTEQQYLYVHQVILLYLKRAKFLDEVVYPYLDAFTKDYAVATKGPNRLRIGFECTDKSNIVHVHKNQSIFGGFLRGYSPDGQGAFDSNVSDNIQNAYNAGLGIEVYMTPSLTSTKTGPEQFQEMYRNLEGRFDVRAIWLQVTMPVKWEPYISKNVEFISSIINAAEVRKFPSPPHGLDFLVLLTDCTGMYSEQVQWLSHQMISGTSIHSAYGQIRPLNSSDNRKTYVDKL
ncbi:Protein-tyrosine phosphatase [Necator americanus]|uniref:Protein-tyrosine phosphatase n=1 Tax=Necator americanus TaxID=51031 RepID=W2TMI0_NECAM|nr:Protein-tyrosine phosphatase [Necator americanus]ETN83300.1 Protein-tyrosine phosphatase [Necator americanus]